MTATGDFQRQRPETFNDNDNDSDVDRCFVNWSSIKFNLPTWGLAWPRPGVRFNSRVLFNIFCGAVVKR